MTTLATILIRVFCYYYKGSGFLAYDCQGAVKQYTGPGLLDEYPARIKTNF